MRVLVVTNMYPTAELPHLGIFVHHHVQGLQRQGVAVDVFFVNSKLGRQAYFTSLPSLANRLKRKWDIVHAQHTYCVLQTRLLQKMVADNAPLVFTCHEGEIASVRDRERSDDVDLLKRMTYSKSLKRRAIESSNCVIFVEERMPRRLRVSGNYEVIPPGVDLDAFRPMEKAHARERLDIPDDRPIIFFPGGSRKSYVKGFDLFEEAVAALSRPVRVIMGDAIPHDQMPFYMNAADVVVQTSRFEGSPMVIKEAMACATSVVSTDVGDVRTLFDDLPGHFLSASSSTEVCGQIEKALSFRGATGGRQRILDLGLSIDSVSTRYVDLFKAVLERKPTAA